MAMKSNLKEYLSKSTLYPFYGTLLLYFLFEQPFLGYAPVIAGGAFVKVLPVWSLAYFVRSNVNMLKGNVNTLSHDNYRKFIFCGLLSSSLGDALLVPSNYFIPGMMAFAIAHIFYILAFGPSWGSSRIRVFYIILGAIAFVVTFLKGIDNLIMASMVMLYVTLILTMSWRASSAHERLRTFPAFSACVGGLLFLMSDFLLAVDKWMLPVPCADFFIMTLYYWAQFFIARSTER